MADTPLVVPIQLDAMVVNNGVSDRDTFRWWEFTYLALGKFKSPEPEAGDRDVQEPEAGVYLHWTLPRALRSGAQQDPRATRVGYPLVPNRWLVVRFYGSDRRGTGWVIESDCPYTDASAASGIDVAQTSQYLVDQPTVRMWTNSPDPNRNGIDLDPNATDPQWTNIGIPFPLAGVWRERSPETMFLTAVAPANPAFSIYYPHNKGVFSFYDDLADVDSDTLSYLVVGWYSDASKDILASWTADTSSAQPFADLLSDFRWTLEGGSESQPVTSLYEGMVFSVPWDRNGDPPANDPLEAIRESARLNVAVGNTAVDAFTAMISQQLSNSKEDAGKAKLLRAFQYDMLPLLNEVNGDALLDERIRQEWFGSSPGGYSWTIVPVESDGSAAATLTADESTWLAQLNSDQARLDAELQKLFGLQWRLNELWYKQGFLSVPSNVRPFAPPGISDLQQFQSQLADELDGAAAGVVAQLGTVKNLLSKVPQPDWAGAQTAQDAFQNGIRSFANSKGLDEAKVLKPQAAPRFWQANNPVVIISGVEPSPSSDPNESLRVRLATHLVNGFEVGGRPVSAGGLDAYISKLLNSSAVPDAVPALIREFYFLDPLNAPSIAQSSNMPEPSVSSVMKAHDPSTYAAPLPGLDLTNWTQPWNPMYLEWTLNYTHIPHQDDGHLHWGFDGTDYHYNPADGMPLTEERSIGGMSLLSPHAQFVFRSRLEEFIQKYGSDADLQNLDDFIGKVDAWQFLTQELTGFNELLALRDGRAYRRPSRNDSVEASSQQYPLADLIGYGDDTPGGEYALPNAYKGRVNTVPYLPSGLQLEFHGVRQGQVYFSDLLLYDKFGRVLYLIESDQSSGLFDAQSFPLIVDDAFQPRQKIHTTFDAVAELPPRLLQPARLDIDLLDQKDDQKVYGASPDANPVCGWVLPNHLDDSILVYAPDGQSLGEFRLVETDQGGKVGEWQPPPHSNFPSSLNDVGQVSPRLQQMLSAAQLQVETNFQAFLDAIDSTLWTIDPLGNRSDQNLSVLIGRPLALMRAQLRLSLGGPAITDTGWAATLDPPAPEFQGYNFSVRLGDQATRQDGVVGYFLEDDYDTFNSVAAPPDAPPQNYVNQIGPLGAGGGQNFISLQFNDASAARVTLLVDPRAAIHATTGILPVKELRVPAQLIEAPLSKIEVGFRVNPILSFIEQTPAQGGTTPQHAQAITCPFPSAQNGVWSWWEGDAASGGWNGYDLERATPNAQLKSVANTLREGFLQFVVSLTDDS